MAKEIKYPCRCGHIHNRWADTFIEYDQLKTEEHVVNLCEHCACDHHDPITDNLELLLWRDAKRKGKI
jgi:hypothetical protein